MLTKKTKTAIVELMKCPLPSFRRTVLSILLQKSSTAKTELMRAICGSQILRNKLRSSFYEKTLERLGINGFYQGKNLTIHESLEGVFFLFKIYSQELESYIRLRKLYESKRLLKDYDAANCLLNEIESSIGCSVWACGQRMLLKELSLGLEANKHELSRLTTAVPQNLITVYLLFYYSCIIETNLSYSNYKTEVLKYIQKCYNSDIGKYLSDKLLIDTPYEDLNISLLLQVDMQYSIIDLFNTVERILPIYYKEPICNGSFNAREMNIPEIHSNLFNNLQMIAGEREDEIERFLRENIEMYAVLEAYTAGNYCDAIEHARHYLKEKPYDFQIATILCKALLNANMAFPNDIKIEYMVAIYSIYKMDDKCHESVLTLQKELKYSYTSALGTKIHAFLSRKHFSESNEDIVFHSSLLDEGLHPNFARYLGDSAHNFLDNYFRVIAPISASMVRAQLWGSFSQDEQSLVSSKRLLFARAEFACYNSKADVALNYLRDLKKYSISRGNGYLYEKERVSRIKLVLYNRIKNYCPAIHLLVDTFFENEYLFYRLASGNYLSLPRKISTAQINKDVYYCVLIYLLDRNDYARQIVAYNNLLDLNGYTDILTALSILNDQDADGVWNFFFYKVCTISLLKRDRKLYRARISPEAARTKILQALFKKQKRKEYTVEINDILTTEALRNKLNTINKSRIHVDIDKIYRSNHILWEESYSKYLESREFKTEILNVNFAGMEIQKGEDQLNYDISSIPLIQQQTLVLRGIIEQIIEECLFSTQYGLETYLSSRIRHGYCKGQLINFLSELHLISMRDNSQDTCYYVNEYWDELVKEQSLSYDAIKQELSDFTRTIEEKAEEVRAKWLKIKYKEPSDGMFDYSELSNVLGICLIINDWEPIKEFHAFFKDIVDIFWKYTDSSLKSIRERISRELTQFYIDAIDNLEIRLKERNCDCRIEPIKQEILKNCKVAKSGVVAAMEQFKAAFSRNLNHYANFTMDELINSCRKVLEGQYGQRDDVIWEIDVDDTYSFSGKYFIPFVDVLCIFLNNAITHSELSKEERLTIRVEINKIIGEGAAKVIEATNYYNKPHDHVFCMQVSNTLGACVDSEVLAQKIQKIFDKVNKEKDNRKQIQQEGGSGLYKLCKTVEYNIEAPYYLSYGVEAGKIYFSYCFIADQLCCQEEDDDNSDN